MDSNDSKFENISLRDVFFILKKHISMILIITVICTVMGFVISKFFVTPMYQANATLIVNANNSQSTQITGDQINTAKELVSTYSIILKSDTVLNKVIKNLNLNIDVATLQKLITVDSVNQTEVISLSVKYEDSKTAQDITSEIINVAPDIIIQTVKAGSVEVISPAKASAAPVSPNVKLYTLIAFLIGLIISVSVAFIMQILNNSFTSDEDVQKYLDLPVLGIIPKI